MQDVQMLNEWCNLHWDSFIHKTLQGSNSFYFHECCFAFSRKGFLKKSNHPRELTVSCHRIKELKACTTANAFFNWILGRIHLRILSRKTTYFPAINNCHEDTDSNTPQREQRETIFLSKRIVQLQDEVYVDLPKISSLQKQNKKLLKSAQTWYKLYENAKNELDRNEIQQQGDSKMLEEDTGNNLMNFDF